MACLRRYIRLVVLNDVAVAVASIAPDRRARHIDKDHGLAEPPASLSVVCMRSHTYGLFYRNVEIRPRINAGATVNPRLERKRVSPFTIKSCDSGQTAPRRRDASRDRPRACCHQTVPVRTSRRGPAPSPH